MKENKSLYKKLSFLILFLVIIGPFIHSYLTGTEFDSKLKNKSVIISGKILEFKRRNKLTDAFFYQFTFNSNVYTFDCSASSNGRDYAKLSGYIIGKSVPVLVNTAEPAKYSKALIVPEDFAEYNIPFPDSMKWVIKLLEK